MLHPPRTHRFLALLIAAGGIAAGLAPCTAVADPSLRIEARKATSKGSLMPFLRETSWWIAVDGRADDAPLESLEYWAQGLEGSRRRTTGSFDLSRGTDVLAGKVSIRFAVNADHAKKLQVRLRLHDVNGNASDWQKVEFPTDAEIADDDAPVGYVEPESAPARHTQVDVLASDTMSLADIRTELERAARVRGGRIVGEPRIAGAENGKTRFVADVEVDAAVAATPTPPTQRRTNLTIGEIFLPEEPLR